MYRVHECHIHPRYSLLEVPALSLHFTGIFSAYCTTQPTPVTQLWHHTCLFKSQLESLLLSAYCSVGSLLQIHPPRRHHAVIKVLKSAQGQLRRGEAGIFCVSSPSEQTMPYRVIDTNSSSTRERSVKRQLYNKVEVGLGRGRCGAVGFPQKSCRPHKCRTAGG